MFLSTQVIDLQLSFATATWLRILQYIPLGFIFIPSSTAAYVGIAAEKNNAVAGLVNFMRNIGSSVGTSVVTTLLARRSQFHQGRLAERATPLNPGFQNSINGVAQQLLHSGMNFADAQRHALARFYVGVQAQAATLAYIDIYFVIAAAAGIMFLLSFALRPNNPRAAAKVSGH
jgi:DHA2 family multidrug resistance protein